MNLLPSKKRLLQWLPDRLVLTHGPRDGGARYLTFDDGPHPEHTPHLLDLLAAHGAHATFFVIGIHAERFPQVTKRIVAEGHALGNHSWSHPEFHKLGLDEQLAEIERGDRALQAFDGRERHRFRSPRGVLSARLLMALARQRRAATHWSRDSLDYRGLPAAEIAARLQRDPPAAGDIILMHDDSACAADALEILLPQWCAAGHTFAALPEQRP